MKDDNSIDEQELSTGEGTVFHEHFGGAEHDKTHQAQSRPMKTFDEIYGGAEILVKAAQEAGYSVVFAIKSPEHGIIHTVSTIASWTDVYMLTGEIVFSVESKRREELDIGERK